MYALSFIRGEFMDRDFKGVWIPKEIWLSNELSMIEKVVLTEINSLDNEDHCVAGNEYFAEFCNCGVATITRAIKHLKELNYIEEMSFDGRHRRLRVINLIKQTNQNDEADSSKRLANNITSNTRSIQTNTNVLVEEKPKKKNLYNKCSEYIMQYTNNVPLQDALTKFLNLRLEIARTEGKPFYYNMWPPIVNDLDKLAHSTEEAINIVNQSATKGWKKFYALKTYSNQKTIKTEDYENDVHTSKNRDIVTTDEVY